MHLKHNAKYLTSSFALPNYDATVVPTEANLADLASQFSGAKTQPMGAGVAAAYMPGTGGRGDIGLLPSWSATYLLTMDKRAKDVMLGTADLAGQLACSLP